MAMPIRSAAANASSACLTSGITVTVVPSKDGAFWSLKLGQPTSVEVEDMIGGSDERYPVGTRIRWDFPARGEMPPVTLTWSDGGLKPARPSELDPDDPLRDIIYIGDKGKLMGERLIPESRMETYKKPAKTLEEKRAAKREKKQSRG